MSVRANVTKFNIDQSLQLSADQFEIGVSGTWPFEERGSLSLLTEISSGLLDKNGDRQLVRHIKDGVVDEVELKLDSRTAGTTIRGRDAAAYAIDTTLYIQFGGAAIVEPATGLLAPLPGVTTVLHLPGTWTASAIARYLATRVGLEMAWQAPDYRFRESFSVSGTVLAAIQDLVAPFSQFEPSKVDVWTEGKTLMVRSRPGLAESPEPGAPAVSVRSFEIRDLKARGVQFRSSVLSGIRVLRLTGAGQGAGGPCESITEDEVETLLFDATGDHVTTRVVERTTRRHPDEAILKVVKTTEKADPDSVFGSLRLTQLEKTTCDHDRLFFDEDCNLLNTPREHRQLIEIEAIDPDSTISSLQPVEEHHVTFQYDGEGFRTTQATDKFTWNKDEKHFDPLSSEVIRLVPKGILEYEQITDNFVPGESGWTLQSSRKSPAGGHLPGGPGRSLPNNVSSKNPFHIEMIIDSDLGTKDFQYSNPNLDLGQLNTIRNQAVAASTARELEVTFTASGIPWLHKGQRIRIIGIQNPAGDVVLDTPLDTFLVMENRIDLEETRDGPLYTSQVRAVNWTHQTDEDS